ncbi:hypothetical protein [Microbacterium xylanilyticum]
MNHQKSQLTRRIANLLQRKGNKTVDVAPMQAESSSDVEAQRVHQLVQGLFGKNASCLVEWKRSPRSAKPLVARIEVEYQFTPRLAYPSYRDWIASRLAAHLEGDWTSAWDVDHDVVAFERRRAS